MTREEYNALKGFIETLISTLKEKITAADATAYDAEKKRNEYDKIMKEEYSRGRHYREVRNMLDEMNQKYYDDMKELEKQQYNTTVAQTNTDPNSISTTYNKNSSYHSEPVNLNGTATLRQNEEVRVDGNQA